jgi:predicted transcriptional regulator/transcriptional regulator with XRE-family HTH domain
MRAPIGIRISSRRKALGRSQAALARTVGISPSYLNLIERNKRDVGGAVLLRIAAALGLDIGELTGEAEHRLVADVAEAFADPVLAPLGFDGEAARDVVAGNPALAAALARLHRAYAASRNERDAYADRLRTDPLLREMLHQVLSGITAVRSGAEILADVPDIGEDDRRRFVASIGSEARMLTGVARNLLGHFESEAAVRRAGSPARELDDLIFENDNYFAGLEAVAASLRHEVEAFGPFGEAALTEALARRFAVTVGRSGERQRDAFGFPGQYRYDAEARTMWFEGSAIAATRQFQLARLYAELAAGDAIAQEIDTPLLTGEAARRLAFRALGSYLAAAVVLPYENFLGDAEALRYDIEALRQTYMASFEQVAHRLATLRRPDARGIAFGFLRSDPAGRLTKHFPLPGLLLPTSGHACPLWVIYEAFRQPETLIRQPVRFADGSRYLFLARAGARRSNAFGDRRVHTSVMLACDLLDADRTVYARGLDLAAAGGDVPVGPACRLCTRADCASRQEEAALPGEAHFAVRAPLVPRSF